MTERDYNECLAYSKTVCKDHEGVDAEDIVSEAFIKMREDGLTYSFENIKSRIRNVFLKIRHETKFVELNEGGLRVANPIYNIAPTRDGELRCCKICKQKLPYSEFYSNLVKSMWVWGSYCKPCHHKKYNSNRTLKITKSYVIRLLKKTHTRAYLMAQSWVVDIKQDQLIFKRNRA